MAKIVNDELFDEIISEGPTSYFKHTEEVGEVEVVFKSGIFRVDPGEEDIEGRIWNPPLVDKVTGQPYLDFNGNPRQPWTKYEARCTIDGLENIYPFNGRKSSILRAMLGVMKSNGISNSDLPGTKWTINRTGKWDWKVTYLGKEDDSSSSSTTKEEIKIEEKINEGNEKIKDILNDYKDTKPEKMKEGIVKNSLIQMICFELDMIPADVESELKILDKNGFLSIKDNKIIID